jgi:hypothetical protein
MKAHTGMDFRSGIVHWVCTTAASVADRHTLADLLHRDERKVWGDGGNQGQSEVICEAAPHTQDMTSRRTRYKSYAKTRIPLRALLRRLPALSSTGRPVHWLGCLCFFQSLESSCLCGCLGWIASGHAAICFLTGVPTLTPMEGPDEAQQFASWPISCRAGSKREIRPNPATIVTAEISAMPRRAV